MEQLPRRTNLASETAATLKEWINNGVLRDVLPGELQLKARLCVGRDTLRLGLKLLADEGWISPAVKGQQRRIHIPCNSTPPPNRTAPLLPVTFLSPHPVEARVTLLELEETQVRLAEQGRNLRFVAPDIFHLNNPDSRLERLVRENPSAAWILYAASEPMQRWFEKRKIPTLIYGSPFPDVTLPFVVSDWEAAAFHAGIQLVRQGHRIIGAMEYRERFPGVLAQERGLQRALDTVSERGRLLRFADDRTPESVARALDSAFNLSTRPTALVLTYASQLLTCYSWFVAKGIRVPGDLSVISLVNDSWLNELYPSVCYYRPDTKHMARSIAQRVLELVDTGRTTRKSIRIPLDYVPGASIGPAAQSAAVLAEQLSNTR
ncbi:MAG TPA: substrate-binding domain-containing protein [Verrucomicrobiae bacterium]|nr:substrate-binding domain-containing protein [Verrucomicrobiae bacterium]